MKNRVAVIGAGVAGLSAAYHLRDQAELTIFERDSRAGGHANTIAVRDGGQEIGIDTAFVVFNGRTYPMLSQWFNDLGVATKEHRGGFNFFDSDTGLQYGSREFELDAEQVARCYPEAFVEVWSQAQRFYRESPRDFIRGRADMPLGDYLDRGGYTEEFKRSFVVLLATAVWSVPHELIWEMPASTFIAFFMSHDPGGLGGHSVAWKTVADGSRTYVKRALAKIGATVRLSTPVEHVRGLDEGVEVRTAAGSERFDQVIVATHADQALRMLADPTPLQRQILERVRYSATTAVLHTDPSVLPSDRTRWQSWNYGRVQLAGAEGAYVVYWMNPLQGFAASTDYFVTLDYPLAIAPERVIQEIPYTHPIIDMGVRVMQRRIYEVNRQGRIVLCGSYFHAPKIGPDLIGSHEAAFCSGREAALAVRRHVREPAGATS